MFKDFSLSLTYSHTVPLRDMNIKSFKAGKGDSFLLSWQEGETPHRLLLDAGLPGTYRSIRDELVKSSVLDGVVLTHVDIDHIGGFFRMMEDDKNGVNHYPVYMNTPSLALVPGGDGKVGYKHGQLLENILVEKGIELQPLFVGMNADNIVRVGGLQLQILSPNRTIIDAFAAAWTAEQIFEQDQASHETDGKVARRTGNLQSYEAILEASEAIPRWEQDLINASSIAFIGSIGDLRMLFLGDANPEKVYEELTRLGYSAANPLRLDFCKISHHGSRHNTSRNLLSVIDCRLFNISTDGSGPSYHPDRETLVRLAAFARPDFSIPIRICTNYALELEGLITAKECEDWNITIDHAEEIHL